MSTKPFELPPGLTMEELDEYARVRENARRRADYARHPERAERQRLRAYTNYLRKHGRVVLENLPPWPWTDSDRAFALSQLIHAAQEVGQIW